jgi:hypothetical protein
MNRARDIIEVGIKGGPKSLLKAGFGLSKHQQRASLAIEAAERVLPIFEEAYPDDTRPRKAIEAARAWLQNPSDEKRVAAEAAGAAAGAAAEAGAGAAWAAGAAEAAWAAEAAGAAQRAAQRSGRTELLPRLEQIKRAIEALK